MSTRLELPPSRGLPEARRREIRAALVAASHRRRHARRWLVTAPIGVLALLLGLGLGVVRPWETREPVVGVPATSPSGPARPTPDPTTSSPTPAAPTVPAARATDRGPLSDAARTNVVSRCLTGLGRSTTVETVHLARRTSTSGDVMLFTGRDGLAYACSDDEASLLAGPGLKTRALPEPDAEHPAVRVDGDGLSSGSENGHVSSTTTGAYRVDDEVASLQSRLVVDGHAGPWFEASRAGGWAWTSATVEYTSSRRLTPRADHRVEVRAFDASGNRLGVDRTR